MTAADLARGLADAEPRLLALRARRIFLTLGDFHSGLGLLGVEPPETAALTLAERGADAALLSALLSLIEAPGERPKVIHLGTLLGILDGQPASAREPAALRAILSNACLTVYGTDGSRGEVSAEPLTPAEALRRKLAEQTMCPRLFERLAFATICALRDRGLTVSEVPVGWDTRDLFVEEGGGGIFRRALVDGVKRSGAEAIVLGGTPIANSSYILAALQGQVAGATLSFNKTASHNPPSHDGLKTFLLDPQSGQVRKLRPREEVEITAWLLADALGDVPADTPGGERDASERAGRLWREVLSDPRSIGAEPDEVWRAAALVYDGSNGAAGTPAAREAMLEALGRYAAPDCERVARACAPNGRNINDHCGAGGLEGVFELTEAELNGPFAGFESVAEVWRRGRARREASQQDGRLVYGLATDGDSDRSYACIYDPFTDSLRFIDGDAAILLQVLDGLERGRLGPGDVVAFTIESAATFAQTLLDAATQAGVPAALEMYGEPDPGDASALRLALTPVGDKWVLETAPRVGGEATGHLIRPAAITSASGHPLTVHAGNGPLGLLATVSAVERRIAGRSGEALRRALDALVNPYPAGPQLTCYAYFVERGRFYAGGAAWEALVTCVEAALARHAADYQREVARFEDDPNTWLVVLRDGAQVAASLHVRCSGTEPKIGLKASAADRPELRALLEELDERCFELFTERLADEASVYWRRQRRALELLAAGPSSWAAIRAQLLEGPADALFESQDRFLLKALQRQRLMSCDADGLWQLSERGQRFAARLS